MAEWLLIDISLHITTGFTLSTPITCYFEITCYFKKTCYFKITSYLILIQSETTSLRFSWSDTLLLFNHSKRPYFVFWLFCLPHLDAFKHAAPHHSATTFLDLTKPCVVFLNHKFPNLRGDEHNYIR
jgi:hypothetical protein